jgi:LuxR family transcriptional regulator, quorum-sensing system regulator SdiA
MCHNTIRAHRLCVFLLSNAVMIPSKDSLDLDLAYLSQLAPAGYHIGLHYRFGGPLFQYQTYDPAWLQMYFERGYLQHDPTMAWAMAQTGVVRWHDLADRDPAGILQVAAEQGLRFGIAVAIEAAEWRTIACFARADRDFSDTELAMIVASVRRMHDETQPPEPLSKSVADALRCVAEGDRLAVGAARLGITERAMKARLMSARTKLGARTSAEAVRLAILYRLI